MNEQELWNYEQEAETMNKKKNNNNIKDNDNIMNIMEKRGDYSGSVLAHL